jgi:hypothetical protein
VPQQEEIDGDRAGLDLLLRGFQISRMLRVVADLGIADRIGPDDILSLDDLAAACGVQPQPLLRILRALAAFAIFAIAPDGSIAHTPRSRLLRTDAPNSMHHAARFWTADGPWRTWEKIDVALTGETIPHEAAWGMSRFDYLQKHPDEARLFDAMMANFPDNRHAAIAAAYDFSGARLIADVGGGDGATLRHILARFSAPSGLLFEREDVIRSISHDKLLGGRISLAAGSFFESVPVGADIYMLTRVLHNWPDADCLRILRACRAAMEPDALLLLGEQILEPNPADGRPTDYLLDVQMMAMFGSARTRTEREFTGLLANSGFAVRRIVPTTSPVSLVEAAPA